VQNSIRLAILGTVLSGSLDAGAQGVVTQRILSLPAAKLIAEAALEECASQGFQTTVAVIDRAGHLLALLRHEQANPGTIDMARGKAYTALVFRSPTLEFQKSTANDPTRTPQRDVPGILALGGGVPIVTANEIIGAVASSGSNQTMDDQCARAGAAKAASLLSESR
jgi:uncharacterized protein GlcG (DUF336 family)